MSCSSPSAGASTFTGTDCVASHFPRFDGCTGLTGTHGRAGTHAGDGMGVASDAGAGSNASARKVVVKLVVDKGVQGGNK